MGGYVILRHGEGILTSAKASSEKPGEGRFFRKWRKASGLPGIIDEGKGPVPEERSGAACLGLSYQLLSIFWVLLCS